MKYNKMDVVGTPKSSENESVHTPKGLDMGTNEDLCTLPAIPEP
jgi:hypothetical protein